MKATELRIGNIINIGGNTIDTYQDYGPKEVTLDILREIRDENNERPNAILSSFKPISLSKEWMKKFRAKKAMGSNFIIYKNGYSFELAGCEVFYLNGRKINIHSVHQLQNLYFALTGEELTITEIHKKTT